MAGNVRLAGILANGGWRTQAANLCRLTFINAAMVRQQRSAEFRFGETRDILNVPIWKSALQFETESRVVASVF
jgi:hypothetical protein